MNACIHLGEYLGGQSECPRGNYCQGNEGCIRAGVLETTKHQTSSRTSRRLAHESKYLVHREVALGGKTDSISYAAAMSIILRETITKGYVGRTDEGIHLTSQWIRPEDVRYHPLFLH